MAKTPGDRPSGTTTPMTTTSGEKFTENKGNTISVSGPIPVAPTPPTQPALPLTESKNSDK